MTISLSLFAILAQLAGFAAAPASSPPRAPVDAARAHYIDGTEQFNAGDKQQALIHFKLSYEYSQNLQALFGMAQCEYHLGRLKEARAHYQDYLRKAALEKQPDPMAMETARLRIEAIDRRPSRIQIESDPDEVDVTLERLDGTKEVTAGQAPNGFDVHPGRWRVTVSKPNFITEMKEVSVDIVETKVLFFKLEKVPARLEIYTRPRGATLYVQGNRARNPYVQTVAPGSYEIYAEAAHHESRTEVVTVTAGDKLVIDFPLRYVQRSGRPELIGFWTGAGAVAAGTAVLARLNLADANGAGKITGAGAVVTAAALVGGVAGGLISTAYAPDYIRDNLALFRIGAMWIGAAQGATLALSFEQSLTAGWVGGAIGLGTGAVVGTTLDRYAPNYGRVALIQSAAAIGGLAGALAVSALEGALDLDPSRDTPRFILGGLNLGLAAGLALAYLPDQRNYGPSWQRVALVDLAVGAGAFAGALVSTINTCIETGGRCRFDSNERTAQLALVGGGVGLVAGWLLTRSYDKNYDAPSERVTTALIPVPTLMPTTGARGRTRLLPGLASQGRF